MKSQLIGKDPDAGKDWGQEERGTTEDEMVGWHHWLSGHELEQTPGDSEGRGSLACCSPWGSKESDMTYQLNSNKKKFQLRETGPIYCLWLQGNQWGFHFNYYVYWIQTLLNPDEVLDEVVSRGASWQGLLTREVWSQQPWREKREHSVSKSYWIS